MLLLQTTITVSQKLASGDQGPLQRIHTHPWFYLPINTVQPILLGMTVFSLVAFCFAGLSAVISREAARSSILGMLFCAVAAAICFLSWDQSFVVRDLLKDLGVKDVY